MKKWLILVLLLLCARGAFAQQTIITATVVGSDGNPYASGTGSANLVCPGNAAPTYNNSTVPRTFTIPGINGFGSFTMTLYDVNAIAPVGCAYQFSITESCGVANFRTGNVGGALQSPAITGAGPVDLSSAINAYAAPLSARCVVPGSGTLRSVALTEPAEFSVSGSPITGNSGTFVVTKVSQAQNLVWASPCGSSGLPIFRAICAGDLPGGVGTVSTFSAGNLSPLFTTTVTNAATTPALSFTLSNASANTFYRGPNSGGAGASFFGPFVVNDFNGGTGASSTSFWAGDLTWKPIGKAILAVPTLCNLGGNISGIAAATPQVIITCSTTAPSAGCPCRAMVSWTIIGGGTSSTQQVEGIVSDGTSSFDGTAGTMDNQITFGFKGIARSDYSPNLYSNSQSVTFTLTGESDHTWTAVTASFYLSAPTQVRVTYLSSN